MKAAANDAGDQPVAQAFGAKHHQLELVRSQAGLDPAVLEGREHSPQLLGQLGAQLGGVDPGSAEAPGLSATGER